VPKIWKTKDEMSKRLVASKIRIIIWALGCWNQQQHIILLHCCKLLIYQACETPL
jgi:hypothetical protein